jgi:hypothetical protein
MQMDWAFFQSVSTSHSTTSSQLENADCFGGIGTISVWSLNIGLMFVSISRLNKQELAIAVIAGTDSLPTLACRSSCTRGGGDHDALTEATSSTAICSGLSVYRDRAHSLSHGRQVTRDDLRRVDPDDGRAGDRSSQASLACMAWNQRMLGFQGPARIAVPRWRSSTNSWREITRVSPPNPLTHRFRRVHRRQRLQACAARPPASRDERAFPRFASAPFPS